MSGTYTVALVGFASNEASTFESFFRLASRRPPAYLVQDEVLDAEFLIVNADNAQAMHLVSYAHLSGKVLLVGLNDGGTGWPLQRKPIKFVGVLTALDAMARADHPGTYLQGMQVPPVSVRHGGDRCFAATEPYISAPAPLDPTPTTRSGRPAGTDFANTRPMVRRMAIAQSVAPVLVSVAPGSVAQIETARLQRPGVMGVTNFGGLEEMPVAAGAPNPPTRSQPLQNGQHHASNDEGSRPATEPEVRRGEVLLVAESLVEGRILHKRFKKYELSIDWSREASQALAMIKAYPYRLVVIDRLNGTPDAYAVCRAAKQRKLANGSSTVVVMFAPSAGSMDRLKAGLAGSDAYLTRSVSESELYRVLARHRLVNENGFEQTNMGGF